MGEKEKKMELLARKQTSGISVNVLIGWALTDH